MGLQKNDAVKTEVKTEYFNAEQNRIIGGGGT